MTLSLFFCALSLSSLIWTSASFKASCSAAAFPSVCCAQVNEVSIRWYRLPRGRGHGDRWTRTSDSKALNFFSISSRWSSISDLASSRACLTRFVRTRGGVRIRHGRRRGRVGKGCTSDGIYVHCLAISRGFQVSGLRVVERFGRGAGRPVDKPCSTILDASLSA